MVIRCLLVCHPNIASTFLNLERDIHDRRVQSWTVAFDSFPNPVVTLITLVKHGAIKRDDRESALWN